MKYTKNASAERAEEQRSLRDASMASLQSKRDRHRVLAEERKKLLKRRKRQQRGAFGWAVSLFCFPFNANAFSAMWEAALFLLCTLIFASVASFVGLGIVLCAILDGLYAVLFFVAYPFIALFLLCFGGAIARRTEKRLMAVEKKIKALDIISVEREIALRERETHREASSDRPSSGIENTDYYKEQKDKYYRQYMGFPPKDDKPLSDLATDPTLDLHPGDY